VGHQQRRKKKVELQNCKACTNYKIHNSKYFVNYPGLMFFFLLCISGSFQPNLCFEFFKIFFAFPTFLKIWKVFICVHLKANIFQIYKKVDAIIYCMSINQVTYIHY